MKTTHAALLVVLAVIAGGLLFVHLHNPAAFDRFTGGPVSSPATSTPAPPKPTLPARLTAPAVKAIHSANAKADEIARQGNEAKPVHVKPATAVPPAVHTAAKSKPVAAAPFSIVESAAASSESPATPLPTTPTSVVSVSSIMNSPSDVINAPSAPATPAAPEPSIQTSPTDTGTPLMLAAPTDDSSVTAAAWTPPSPTPAQPNWTWTTTGGQVYQKVKVIKMDPQNVTILHQDGGATVPMETLPPDLQKLFNYNPVAARQWEVGKLVAENLVALRNGSIRPVPGTVLRPVRYIAVYYSAAWCPPCESFTPALVRFYEGFKPIHSDFEVIFVSEDRNPIAMAHYMREARMPWLAVRYDALVHPPGQFKGSGIEAFAGKEIPDLVLLDATGRVLSDSYRGGKYVGPTAVLNDIPSIVK